MTDSATDLEVTQQGPVTLIRMRRPPFNYFDLDLLRGIADALQAADAKDEVRVTVLAAEGRAFCAGADFTSRSDRDPGAVYAQAARIFDRQKPMIAAVQGGAVGGGLGLALAADFRVAGPTGFFQANFVRIGLHPGFALTRTLPQLVGKQVAADLLLSGRRVQSEEALRLGLADRLVDGTEVTAGALELAQSFASGAPLALKSIRAALVGTLSDEVRQAMRDELAAQAPLFESADFREGVAAYAARRAPTFTGA